VAGNKKANLRQVAQQRLREAGTPCRCIRCREIRRDKVRAGDLELRDLVYDTDATHEHFLSFETASGYPNSDRLAGFLRLSLPDLALEHPFPELAGHAMIREVHIYGPALNLGDDSRGEAQHIGLGARLIAHARQIAREAGYRRIAVIAAIGTREYYARLGFAPDGLYMTSTLD
jgi:elongator complex protein 3